MNRSHRKWVVVLPRACFLQNNLPLNVEGHSSKRIVFGRELILPGELPTVPTVTKSDSAVMWFDRIQKMRQDVRDRLQKIHEQERQKFVDKHVRPVYKPGDRVWIKVQSKDREKLEPTWMGPCEVRAHVQSGRYTVTTPWGQDDYCIDQMKEYRPEPQGTRISFAYYKHAVIPEDITWTVDKNLKHRMKNGRVKSQVLWTGCDKPTKEKAEQFMGSAQEVWIAYNGKTKLSITV